MYGVSRQAAHRRFSDATVVPADYFDELLKDLDDKPEVVPALAQAATRLERARPSPLSNAQKTSKMRKQNRK